MKSLLPLLASLPLLAQVDSVEMRTTGISCGVCAMVSEFQFRRMAGVDKVTISLAREAIVIFYKPGGPLLIKHFRAQMGKNRSRTGMQKAVIKHFIISKIKTHFLQVPFEIPVRFGKK